MEGTESVRNGVLSVLFCSAFREFLRRERGFFVRRSEIRSAQRLQSAEGCFQETRWLPSPDLFLVEVLFLNEKLTKEMKDLTSLVESYTSTKYRPPSPLPLQIRCSILFPVSIGRQDLLPNVYYILGSRDGGPNLAAELGSLLSGISKPMVCQTYGLHARHLSRKRRKSKKKQRKRRRQLGQLPTRS